MSESIYDMDDFGDVTDGKEMADHGTFVVEIGEPIVVEIGKPRPVRQKYEIALMQIDGLGAWYGLFGETQRRPLIVDRHIQPLIDFLLPSDPFDLEIAA